MVTQSCGAEAALVRTTVQLRHEQTHLLEDLGMQHACPVGTRVYGRRTWTELEPRSWRSDGDDRGRLGRGVRPGSSHA